MRWCGAPSKVWASSTTRRSRPTFRDRVTFPGLLATRFGRTHSGTTSNHGSFISNRSGRQPDPVLRYGSNGFDSSRPPRSPTRGLTRLGFSSWSICRAGLRRTEPMPGVNLHSSPPPWTSMLRFTNPLRATSGCYVTDRHRSLPAGSSAGLPASGPRKRNSSPPAEVSACTGNCHPTRLRSRSSASSPPNLAYLVTFLVTNWPAGFRTYQSPPLLLIPWPVACPGSESPTQRYRGQPLYVT